MRLQHSHGLPYRAVLTACECSASAHGKFAVLHLHVRRRQETGRLEHNEYLKLRTATGYLQFHIDLRVTSKATNFDKVIIERRPRPKAAAG